ncbi:MAG: FAD-dependent oxidoreductase [Bacteroidia bacterium]|nr:FAD-dependent oxidoreductase [Bacteroidia bacterium]
MKKNIQLTALPEQLKSDADVKREISKNFGIPINEINGFTYLKKSIDARKKPVRVNLTLAVFVNENPIKETIQFDFKNVTNGKEVAIIGAGPAGLFAALQLIELGLKPVIFERGKNVRERRRDLANITKNNTVNPESNYCFGEGGAGTYSDGKLYTRSSKRGDVNRILKLLVYHGADENILYESHPHIGTNKLPHIIEKIRETILSCAGEIHFNSKLTDITLDGDKIKSIEITNNEIRNSKFEFENLILATGHSARDIFELLHRKKIAIEAKPFALGVRIEHPQALIDSIQYKCGAERNPYLPAASYSLVEQVNGRGVFSFCMCPGGIIAPAMTAPGEIVVNGWSPSKRNNPYANSGMVVSINAEDFKAFEKYGPLAGMYFQSMVEKNCFEQGNKTLQAPAQRMLDFVNNKTSNILPDSSYLPGTVSRNLSEILPSYVAKSLQGAMKAFGKKMHGYLTNEAILLATESRTSSPVRIPRNKETFEHIQIKGLYPCAEGAGYAGGIVSAAMDGENCAKAIAGVSTPLDMTIN